MTLGDRLLEERERAGLTQTVLAAVAGTTKKSQIEYEKNSAQPKSGYLAAIAAAGIDVQYILTGVRSSAALAPDERLLLDKYRNSPQAVKDAALRVVMIGGEVQGGIVQHINSNQGQVAGKEIINNDTGAKGGKKPRGRAGG